MIIKYMVRPTEEFPDRLILAMEGSNHPYLVFDSISGYYELIGDAEFCDLDHRTIDVEALIDRYKVNQVNLNTKSLGISNEENKVRCSLLQYRNHYTITYVEDLA